MAANTNKLHWHISKFAIVGLLATCIHAGLFLLLHEVFQLTAQLANFFAWLVAACSSYLGQRHWTFSHINVKSERQAFIKFLTSSALSLLINAGFTYLFVTLYNNSYLAAAAMLCITPVITFLLMRFWVFTNANNVNENSAQ